MSRVAYTQRWPVKELACFMLSEIYTQFKLITDVLNFVNEIAFKWMAKVNEMRLYR